MTDTWYLGLADEQIPAGFLNGVPGGESFCPPSLPGFSGFLKTTDRSTIYRRRGATYMLSLRHLETGLELKGPLMSHLGYWQVTGCRINVPKLIGQPAGFLPETEAEIRIALDHLRSILIWLPSGWYERSKVKELHLTMNFDLSALISCHEMMSAHKLIRHPCVKSDPAKLKDHHNTLYWKGKDTVIALYEKTAEVCEKLAKERNLTVAELRRRYHLHETMRLEFRVKERVLVRLLNRMLEAEVGAPHAPDEGPPLPKPSLASVKPSMIDASMLTELFRMMALDFPEPQLRKPRRYQAKGLAALMIKAGAILPNGAPIETLLALHMTDRSLRETKAMAASMPAGGPTFSWTSCLGTSGYGPHAVPKPECYMPLSNAD